MSKPIGGIDLKEEVNSYRYDKPNCLECGIGECGFNRNDGNFWFYCHHLDCNSTGHPDFVLDRDIGRIQKRLIGILFEIDLACDVMGLIDEEGAK
jgi:hypothetical protein